MSPAPPPNAIFPLTFEKIQSIARWRLEVDHCRSPDHTQDTFAEEPLIDLTELRHQPEFSDNISSFDSLDMYYQVLDDEFDMDRWTFVFDGDERVQSLPSAETNQLMTSEVSMIEEEYCRVLHLWNKFEVEKWRAEKAFRHFSTSENLQDVCTADFAVQSASVATRYIERHANQHRLPINFSALFFRIYRPPQFDLYLADDSWNALTALPPSSQFGLTQSTGCVPDWTIVPPPVQSRMIEV